MTKSKYPGDRNKPISDGRDSKRANADQSKAAIAVNEGYVSRLQPRVPVKERPLYTQLMNQCDILEAMLENMDPIKFPMVHYLLKFTIVEMKSALHFK